VLLVQPVSTARTGSGSNARLVSQGLHQGTEQGKEHEKNASETDRPEHCRAVCSRLGWQPKYRGTGRGVSYALNNNIEKNREDVSPGAKDRTGVRTSPIQSWEAPGRGKGYTGVETDNS